MSIRGTWQLQKVIVQYCTKGGSSRGTREFIRSGLSEAAAQHPQVAFEVVEKRGRHPVAIGEYVCGNSKTQELRNKSEVQVPEIITGLVNTSGRKLAKISKPILSHNPSIQGAWVAPGATEGTEFKLRHVFE